MPREDSIIQERYDLTIERIASILQEHTVSEPFGDYFAKTASFLFMLHQADAGRERSLEEWQEWNRQLYEDILPENYGNSYGNPAYAVGRLGEIPPCTQKMRLSTMAARGRWSKSSMKSFQIPAWPNFLRHSS